jgi:DNA-binding protein WhiA
LILIGATDATLEYENIRVSRDYANSDNRWQNCAIANMEKTIKAATWQIEDIKFLDQLVGIDNLPNVKMVHLARLRLDDESASLLELSNRLGDLLGKPVSRSNIAHVFRQIGELADRYRS